MTVDISKKNNGSALKKGTRSKQPSKRSTIFDDVFRTMAQKMPYLLVPVINEAFGTDYPGDTNVDQLRNEHFEINGEIITDALIRIEGVLYHIECQSSDDDTMCIRMFEYDTAIAIEQAGKRMRRKDIYEIDYPESCVIYIRSNVKTPDTFKIKLNLPGGKNVTYETKAVKVSSYSMEDIFSKNLLMLIPFYLVRYETKAKKIAGSKKGTMELIEECKTLRQRLEDEVYKNRESLYTDLVNFITKVSEHIFRNEEEIKKGVKKTMNGRILTLPSERIERKFKKEGGNLMLYSLVEDRTITPEQAAKKLGISIDDLRKKMALTDYRFPEDV